MERLVIITGNQGGIGRALCEKYVREGWRVCGLDVSNTANLDGVDQYNVDLADINSIKEAVNQITKKYSSIDALVNNAAIQICKKFGDYSETDWDTSMNVNVKSVFFTTQFLFEELKKTSGAVVNISSIHARASSSDISVYAITKSAMDGLTKSLALEAGEHFRVNSILPAAIDTPMLREGLKRGHIKGTTEDDLVRNLGKKHVAGRVGKPAEIAELCYFLTDKSKSSFITGESILVDGGASIKLSTE